MTTQPNTGPNRMRLWADYIEQNVKHHLLPLAVKNPDTLRELAAQWEADLSARDHAVDLAGINAEAANELERRAERAEAALERARALLPDELRECVTKPGRGYSECGCKTSSEGDQHCMYCLWPEWTHELASALSPGGAA